MSLQGSLHKGKSDWSADLKTMTLIEKQRDTHLASGVCSADACHQAEPGTLALPVWGAWSLLLPPRPHVSSWQDVGQSQGWDCRPQWGSKHSKCSFRHLPLEHCCCAVEQDRWLSEFLPVTSQVVVVFAIES